ncbi:MAG: hypothetical protein WAW73_08480 [Rhodoferax sp.]
MSTSPSLPASSSLPPSDSAGGAGAWDRLESDIKVLKQQAQATQKAIQQVQNRESTGPLEALQISLPDLPPVDSTLVGVTAGLGLTVALLWWYLWMRPQARLQESLGTGGGTGDGPTLRKRAKSADPIAAKFAAIRAQPSGLAPLDIPHSENPESLFARHDPNLGFDSEAAASEVVRVRKSLAEKREARSLQLEREEAQNPVPSVRAWLDQDAPDPLDGVEVMSGPIPIAPILAAPQPAASPVPQHGPEELDIALDFELEPEPQPAPPPPPPLEPEPPPEPEPELVFNPSEQSESTGEPDYAITLALAQESEALDLWPEARELANEVLESGNAQLRVQAQALLQRLDQLEHALALESLPPPEETPPDMPPAAMP